MNSSYSVIKSRAARFWGIAKQFWRVRNQPKIQSVLTKVVSKRSGKIEITGTIYCNTSTSDLELVIRKFRQEQIEFRFPVKYNKIPLWKRFLIIPIGSFIKIKSFQSTIDIDWGNLNPTILSISVETQATRSHLSLSRNQTKILKVPSGHAYIFVEPAVKVVRIEFYKISTRQLGELRKLSKKKNNPDKVHCVIGEYTNSARDSGLALFEDLMENDRGIVPYLIVERENLDGFDVGRDNILEFGSVEHLKACLRSNVVAFTHHRTYVYPNILSLVAPTRYKKARTLFLQHGVTAMKRSPLRHYRSQRVKYSAVVTCSQKEISIFKNHFGYTFSQVFATGFPRHDKLLKLSRSFRKKQHVLLFPTWRSGIEKMNSDLAKDTPYIKTWLQAIEVIKKATESPVTLMLHPILQRHGHIFEGVADKVLLPTEFQNNLVGAKLFITDYSSTAFDALYIDCPVVLFQFDRESYGFRRDAFINVDRECPGVVAEKISELPNAISSALTHAPVNTGLYFDRRDYNNCERVASLIRSLSYSTHN